MSFYSLTFGFKLCNMKQNIKTMYLLLHVSRTLANHSSCCCSGGLITFSIQVAHFESHRSITVSRDVKCAVRERGEQINCLVEWNRQTHQWKKRIANLKIPFVTFPHWNVLILLNLCFTFFEQCSYIITNCSHNVQTLGNTTFSSTQPFTVVECQYKLRDGIGERK